MFNRSFFHVLLFLASMIITGSILFGISGCTPHQEKKTAPAQTAKAEPAPLPPIPANLPLSVDFDNVPLSEVAQFVTSQTGKGLILSGNEAKPITWIESNLTRKHCSIPSRLPSPPWAWCSNPLTIKNPSFPSSSRKEPKQRFCSTMPGPAWVCSWPTMEWSTPCRSSLSRSGTIPATGTHWFRKQQRTSLNPTNQQRKPQCNNPTGPRRPE
ncbi:MAG: hypothetical protein PHI97_30260 [Desulfobulbus sp.]|nr:hypothetical protein [Desulfobulbus sp.]